MELGEIKGQFSNLSNLDSINIKSDRGFSKLRMGFAVALIFNHGYENDKRLAFSNVISSYYNLFKDHITHYGDSGTGEIKSIENDSFLDEYDALATRIQIENPDVSEIHKKNPNDFFPNIVARPNGDSKSEMPLYFCGGTCLPLDSWFPKDRLSHLTAYIPGSWVEKNGYNGLLELTKTWCDRLKPLHGTVGLAPLFSPYMIDATSSSLAFSLCKRFIGLDYFDAVKWKSKVNIAAKKHVIRTSNWLSIIDRSFVDQLGGVEKIAAALGDNCGLLAYEGGIILKAGEQAKLGDVESGEILEDYRTIAALLKPLIFQDYKTGLFQIFEPYDSLLETQKWINRFFD